MSSEDTRPEFYPVALDDRVRMMVGRIADDGQVLMMTPDLFRAPTVNWTVNPETPRDVAELLAVVKSLYCHGAFVYEFVAIAVQQALIALEAALAHRLDRPKDSLGDLIDRAHKQGLIDDGQHYVLHEGARHLRNGFGHARTQERWTVGMAAPVIERIHAVIASLWPTS